VTLDRETRELANKNAEGVGFEPTEALRLQRRFAVPTRPASSRLVPTRWLDAWLYGTGRTARRRRPPVDCAVVRNVVYCHNLSRSMSRWTPSA